MERWRNIHGFPTYRVSDKGRVSRVIDGKRRILHPSVNDTGYMRVNLYRDKQPHPKNVHRLVAEEFIPNPNHLEQVNHINSNRSDNRVENLEWCTNKQNMIHAYKYNRDSVRSCIRDTVPIRVVETGDEFESIAECARTLSLSSGLIGKCINGERKTHRGYHYERLD